MKKIKLKISASLIKIISINVVNILLLLLCFLILQSLPKTADNIKELNNKYVLAHERLDQAVLESDLVGSKQKIDILESYFPNENGVLNFISEMEKLRNEGVISKFSFQSDKPIIDSTKSAGFPILISAEGQEESINNALSRIKSLPFYIRAVDVKLSISDDNTIHLDYGGFLYVSNQISNQ